MRKLILTPLLIFMSLYSVACPVCERNQPKILKGITHGSGPDSQWDYLIIWVTVAIVIATLYFSVKWLIRPGENSDQHIKRYILNND